MYRICLLILLIGGFFSQGCASFVKPAVDSGAAAAEEWWKSGGKEKAEAVAKDVAVAVAAGVEKGAKEYADNVKIDLEKKHENGEPWSLLEWILYTGIGLATGTAAYHGNRTIRKRCACNAPPLNEGVAPPPKG